MSPALYIALAALAGAAVALWPKMAKASPGLGFGKAKPAAPLPAYAPADNQNTCDPTPKPGTVRFKEHMLARYGGQSWGIQRDCAIGGTSEHKEGRALDWHPEGSPGEMDVGWEAVAELLATDQFGRPHAEARRWGIQYLVWDRQFWSAKNAAAGKGNLPAAIKERYGLDGAGWRPYSRRGNATQEHRDHVHVSLSRDAGQNAPLS